MIAILEVLLFQKKVYGNHIEHLYSYQNISCTKDPPTTAALETDDLAVLEERIKPVRKFEDFDSSNINISNMKRPILL